MLGTYIPLCGFDSRPGCWRRMERSHADIPRVARKDIMRRWPRVCLVCFDVDDLPLLGIRVHEFPR
jgi:hypothetical protein